MKFLVNVLKNIKQIHSITKFTKYDKLKSKRKDMSLNIALKNFCASCWKFPGENSWDVSFNSVFESTTSVQSSARREFGSFRSVFTVSKIFSSTLVVVSWCLVVERRLFGLGVGIGSRASSVPFKIFRRDNAALFRIGFIIFLALRILVDFTDNFSGVNFIISWFSYLLFRSVTCDQS